MIVKRLNLGSAGQGFYVPLFTLLKKTILNYTCIAICYLNALSDPIQCDFEHGDCGYHVLTDNDNFFWDLYRNGKFYDLTNF